MTKKSLFTLLFIAIAYISVQVFLRPFLRGAPILSQSVTLLYLWLPGIVALIFARIEKMKIPVWKKPNRFFYAIPLITFAISLFAFLLVIPFGVTQNPSPILVNQSIAKMIGYGILFLFTSYLIATILMGLLFLGGELYWRGYLWEKWKGKSRFQAIWWIAFVWVLWQLPVTLLSHSPGLPHYLLNILFTAGFNLIQSPVLFYFREKGKSVLTSALFYSSLIASALYFLVLFPTTDKRILGLYGCGILLGLILYSLIRKLYSPKTWEKFE